MSRRRSSPLARGSGGPSSGPTNSMRTPSRASCTRRTRARCGSSPTGSPGRTTGLPSPARSAGLALHLIDCSPLERMLAQHYRPSAKGQVPFHPVSMLLAVCLGRELALSWRELARLLGGEHGAAWRRLLGFSDGDTPSASGLRYFFSGVGPEAVAELCPQFIELLRQSGRFPERSTCPGDPPGRGVT